MTCWVVLGLPEDADKRSIKRQYASLLKQHRPDEDPEGFQRLREAYEQALEWADWQQDVSVDEEQPAPIELPLMELPTPRQAPTGPSPSQRLAAQCLEAIDATNLASRLTQARLYACEREFEHGLLEFCLAQEDTYDLAEAAIAQLHWLTPWQREDLPSAATEQLRGRLMDLAWSRLTGAWHDSQRFLDVARQLDASPWLQTLDARQWLNRCLAMALLQAPTWSEQLFDAICAQQGWKQTGHHSPCPEPWWSQLLARSHCATFLAQQARLTQFFDSSESQASRMLFGSLDEDARVRLSMTFSAADWDACDTLYRTVQLRYPQILHEKPQLSPDNWRALRRQPPILAVPLAILGTSICMSWLYEYRLGGSFYTSVIDMLLRALLLGVVGWGLHAVCKKLSRKAWRLDDWINVRYGRWLSLRRPSPLPIRENLWVALLGGLIYVAGGLPGAATYFAILGVLGALSQRAPFERGKSILTRLYDRVPGDVLIGLFLGMLVPMVLLGNTWVNGVYLGKNEGLQVWPQRICAARESTASPCPAGLSATQWQAFKEPQVNQP
ncbi:J domain-containing protein [Pseudomonas sp. EA_15y_Pfl2_R67]|uniref:J domain-containing protein n=1 Tax=Pseudomonas sp. EA_15y_Pfl2_R67 TaxID=3088687 RepID=UPI0030D752EC